MTVTLQTLLQPLASRPRSQGRRLSSNLRLANFLKGNFSLSTLLLLGGALQLLLALIIPPIYALLPVLAILAFRLTRTLLVTYHIIPNPYLEDSILGRFAAAIPSLDGTISVPPTEKVVCFHLGAKLNHPLGIFSPHARTVNDYFGSMCRQLDKMPQSESGYLGGSNWTSYDERGAVETTFISYWRDIESLHRFAYGDLHRKGWEWWNKLSKEENAHLGINHEIFEAEPGKWEAVYLNQQPSLLSGTAHQGEDGMWRVGTVDASKGKMRNSAGRLGWKPDVLAKKFEYKVEGYHDVDEIREKA